ncbi:MAG: tetraacyldisaccharide 4'-kinase [Chlorobiaceae bacterium]|nr:tetraacyldisaccharide 4'-kinase [Chlorobiaceae bacterium]MBA4309144.1 tetraacyldisaccharide 4'-kinase [Chlorobiaceae bacterium]
MDYLRVLFYPLIPIYWLAIKIRNFLFDVKIFSSRKVNAKVISIGNLTVGGSGKTPTTIYLIKLLRSFEMKVAVLSRGYGRSTTGYFFVSDGFTINAGVEECGDEIIQTLSEINVPAAVCEDRVEGAQRLIQQTNIDSIVLDDAYQHRWIARNIDLLIFDQRFLISQNNLRRKLLPTGNLREPFSETKRADAIILNRKFYERKEIPEKLKKYFDGKKIFNAYYKALGFIDVKKNTFYSPEEFIGQKSLVTSGIANPHSFMTALENLNIETTNKLIFWDHKFYNLEDIENIRKQFYSTNSQSVITTHKDAVKFLKYSRELDDIDIYYLKIELMFDEQKEFNDFIINKLNEPENKK